MIPAPTACDILGFEECTKPTPSRNHSATEYAARLLINARTAPGSWLDAFLFLAGRESVARHARRIGAWWSRGVEASDRRALRWRFGESRRDDPERFLLQGSTT